MSKTRSPFVGIHDAAELAGVHPATIRRRVADGTLPAKRLGPRLIRIKRSDLYTWLGIEDAAA